MQANVANYANKFKMEETIKAAKSDKNRNPSGEKGKNVVSISKGTRSNAPPLRNQVGPVKRGEGFKKSEEEFRR